MATTKPAARGRDVRPEPAYLTGALKAPTLRESAARLAERARAENWTHEEYLAASVCLVTSLPSSPLCPGPPTTHSYDRRVQTHSDQTAAQLPGAISGVPWCVRVPSPPRRVLRQNPPI